EADQVLLEAMSDKATIELSTPVGGEILELRYEEGDIVEVGSVLAVIDEDGTGSSATAAEPEENEPSTNLFQPTEEKSDAGTRRVVKRKSEPDPPASSAARGPYGRVLAVPAARRRARELGIDIEQLHGS